MLNPRLQLSGIEIIDSLKSTERPTAKTLYSAVETICKDKPGAICNYRYTHSPVDVLDAIVAIRDDVLRTGKFPCLHIEAHGAPEGIKLADDNWLTWEELRPYLSALNCATRLNLVVTMAACKGAHLDTLFALGERAPALVMIGPMWDIDDGPLERAMVAFYSSAFTKGDGTRAWRSMNGMVDSDKLMFDVRHAEVRFEQKLRQLVASGGVVDESRFNALRERFFFLDAITEPKHAERFELSWVKFTGGN